MRARCVIGFTLCDEISSCSSSVTGARCVIGTRLCVEVSSCSSYVTGARWVFAFKLWVESIYVVKKGQGEAGRSCIVRYAGIKTPDTLCARRLTIRHVMFAEGAGGGVQPTNATEGTWREPCGITSLIGRRRVCGILVLSLHGVFQVGFSLVCYMV